MRKGHLPYRGDGNPRIKPRRKFINARKERREFQVLILLAVIGLGALTYIFVISPADHPIDGDSVAGLILVSFVVLVILAAIHSFTKFRKGYDVDISNEEDNHEK